jgi:hypothetical protein
MAGHTASIFLFLFLTSTNGDGNADFGKVTNKLQQLVQDKAITAQREQHMNVWVAAQNAVPFDKRKLGDANFVCPSFAEHAPSNRTPTSVHALRPGDIQVIAALGDSLTAANGAGGQSLLEVLLQYRGMSWDIGGDGDLVQMATIPNILREFSPGLVGASTGVSPVWRQTQSQLNMAVPGSKAPSLKSQAQKLVTRIQNDPNIDFENDWKLVSILIGANDLCQYCSNFQNRWNSRPQAYINDVKAALDILYDSLPRTMVNLVSVFHVELLRQTHKQSLFCLLTHSIECPCITNRNFNAQQMETLVRSYQNLTRGIEASGTYDLREDFTVVVQPYLEDAHLPFTQGGENVDLAFFAPDCFHWSQIGHSVCARGLWNSMFQPVGSKTRDFNPNKLQPLKCPDSACPLIRTTKNSKNCSAYFTPPTTTTVTSTSTATTSLPASTVKNVTKNATTTYRPLQTTPRFKQTTTTSAETRPHPVDTTTEAIPPETTPRHEETTTTTEEPIVTHRPISRTPQPRRTTTTNGEPPSPQPSQGGNGSKIIINEIYGKPALVYAAEGLNSEEIEEKEAAERENKIHSYKFHSSIVLGGLIAVIIAAMLATVVYKKKFAKGNRKQNDDNIEVPIKPRNANNSNASERTPLLSSDSSGVKVM